MYPQTRYLKCIVFDDEDDREMKSIITVGQNTKNETVGEFGGRMKRGRYR